MATKQLTKGTEIAALEAQRNERQVRADGSLMGERRAAIARLAMIIMFGVVSASRSGPKNWNQTAVGAAYTLFAVGTLLALYRIRVGSDRRARWASIVLSTIDYTAITTLGMLDVWFTGGQFNAGQQAIASSIVMAFSLARVSVFYVAYSVLLAEAGLVVLSVYAGTLDTHATVFIMGGYTVLGLMMALTNRAVSVMFRGLRQRDNLTRFLPRQVADRVIAAGPEALVPVQREVTVLFSDIRGFTALSEKLEPRDVLAMLDDYFGRMSQIVKGHDGVVGKFIGDGLLAFWGVPDRLDDHAARAVRAARDMRTALREINRYREQDGHPPFKIGIGIHTGTVAAGMLGGALQSEYTIIGDAVNVASRVEGLTKDHGVDLLISETTWTQLDAPTSGRRLADATIRGREDRVVLYTIDD